MAFSFVISSSVQIPDAAAELFSFAATESVNDMWICNTSGVDITVDLYMDYDGTAMTDVEKFLSDIPIQAGRVLHLTGLWVFQSGGRISGACSVNNGATIHMSKATV